MVAVVTILGGCGIGVGAMSAANRPLFGQRIVDDERTAEYCNYGTVGGLDAQECYIRDESGLSKLGRYVGVGGGVRRGWAWAHLDDAALPTSSITEVHATVMGHLPLKRTSLSLGLSMLVALEGDAFLMGGGLRASWAPIPQLSLDGAYGWGSGSYSGSNGVLDISGSRASLGGTLMLYGRSWWRLALAVAATRTDAGPYQSRGMTYELVSTMW